MVGRRLAGPGAHARRAKSDEKVLSAQAIIEGEGRGGSFPARFAKNHILFSSTFQDIVFLKKHSNVQNTYSHKDLGIKSSKINSLENQFNISKSSNEGFSSRLRPHNPIPLDSHASG